MCTRVFWNDNGVAMVVARTLDWETSDEPRLWVLPRGTARAGGVGEGSVEWASRYGSVTMQGWGCVTSEGINEAGLSARPLRGRLRRQRADRDGRRRPHRPPRPRVRRRHQRPAIRRAGRGLGALPA